MTVGFNDDVAFAKIALSCRSLLVDLTDKGAFGRLHPEAFRKFLRHTLDDNTDTTAGDGTGFDELIFNL